MDFIPEATEYGDRSLDLEDLRDDPLELFQDWLALALKVGAPEPNAMCLCTIGVDDCPDARMVLLKGIDQGLRFYTNYGSDKAVQLEKKGLASVVFWWEPLKRQVRFRGTVERVEPALSDEYFSTRPRASQIGARASVQSKAISNREELILRFDKVAEQFPGEIPRPEYWGGYRLIPYQAEFWQGRTSRLHDRFRFLRSEAGTWTSRRLMP